jgi:hypothetical protein
MSGLRIGCGGPTAALGLGLAFTPKNISPFHQIRAMVLANFESER